MPVTHLLMAGYSMRPWEHEHEQLATGRVRIRFTLYVLSSCNLAGRFWKVRRSVVCASRALVSTLRSIPIRWTAGRIGIALAKQHGNNTNRRSRSSAAATSMATQSKSVVSMFPLLTPSHRPRKVYEEYKAGSCCACVRMLRGIMGSSWAGQQEQRVPRHIARTTPRRRRRLWRSLLPAIIARAMESRELRGIGTLRIHDK